MKKALITGITGQDGAYLAELLLEKGYQVHGVKRPSSQFHTQRIDHLYDNPNFKLYYGNLLDSLNMVKLVNTIKPDEIYNLGAQSHVHIAFKNPEYTANLDGIGVLRVLEAIRIAGLEKKCKFYQASTSELYGQVQETPQTEKTPFYPRSPYASAKLYGYWITINYRESYDMFCSNGILFNHESPIRGSIFVTRKITRAVSRIIHSISKELVLGNLNAQRDWGHAKDYVKGMWKIMQYHKPDDFVLATGKTYSVRYFTTRAFEYAGIKLEWEGEGINEVGKCSQTGRILVRVSSQYYRPNEVDVLLGDPSKAKKELGWTPTYTIDQLIQEMIQSDIELTKKEYNL